MTRFATILLLLASPAALAFPWYASGENIWGANLMSPEERTAYVAKLQTQSSDTECRAYIDAHRAEIAARAKAKNVALPAPGGNPCDVMKRMGRTH